LLATGKELTDCMTECRDSIEKLKSEKKKLNQPKASDLSDEEFKKLFGN
jgi:hypothetical protein